MPHNRPVLRLTPPRNWMNDPNGLIFWRGQYHAFYQAQPDHLIEGPKHWGHAVSDDCVRWRHLPIAISPCAQGEIYSGSAVEDVQNTAGFGKGALVCTYTLHGDVETQGIAYSTDGEHFAIYSQNPVIENPGIPDFRDPRVFWYAPGAHWCMVVAAGPRLLFYRSGDLLHWQQTGTLEADQNPVPGIWECPDLFPLRGPEGQTHWVLIGSMIPQEAMDGALTQVLIGTFDGSAFRVTQWEDAPVWLDHGMDNYAAISFSGLPDDERTIMGWMSNWRYAHLTPQDGYRGQMTLPRQLRLVEVDGRLRIAQALPQTVLAAFGAEAVIDGGTWVDGPCLLSLDADAPAELCLRSDAGETLRIGVGPGSIYVDRSMARHGEAFSPAFTPLRRAMRLGESGTPVLIAVDGGGVEVFADDGVTVLSMLALPTCPWSLVRHAGGGKATIRRYGSDA